MIRLAKSAGFCFGVSRSVELAEKLLADGPCKSLGPLIHNEDVVRKLGAMGLSVIDGPEKAAEGDRVIIRSHGVSQKVEDELRSSGAEIFDATCPNVARIHRIVKEASERGRQVLVIGTKGHPEVQAICGRCKEPVVVANADELESWISQNVENSKKELTVVVQTTQTKNNLDECEKLIKKWCTKTEIFDTICFATSIRQEEAVKLASECGAMVVIGGKDSANSLHLAELCAERCPNTQFIATAAELDKSVLSGVRDVGVTAGASAPA